jgi:hypothetical protein
MDKIAEGVVLVIDGFNKLINEALGPADKYLSDLKLGFSVLGKLWDQMKSGSLPSLTKATQFCC